MALFVNNLGGISNLELGVVTGDLLATPLGQRAELILGPSALMTSIAMRGFSVSVMPLNEPLREALLAPVGPNVPWPGMRAVTPLAVRPLSQAPDTGSVSPSDEPRLHRMIEAACAAVLAEAPRLDALDKQVGDGDTGSTFATAALRIAGELDALPLADPAALCQELARLISRSMGASSGVLLSIMLTAVGGAVHGGEPVTGGLAQGLAAMQRYGGAQTGDRTMIDALAPAIETLQTGGSLQAAAEAARRGADATAEIGATASGRSAYVRSEHLVGAADPGAEAIAVIIGAMAAA